MKMANYTTTFSSQQNGTYRRCASPRGNKQTKTRTCRRPFWWTRNTLVECSSTESRDRCEHWETPWGAWTHGLQQKVYKTRMSSNFITKNTGNATWSLPRYVGGCKFGYETTKIKNQNIGYFKKWFFRVWWSKILLFFPISCWTLTWSKSTSVRSKTSYSNKMRDFRRNKNCLYTTFLELQKKVSWRLRYKHNFWKYLTILRRYGI